MGEYEQRRLEELERQRRLEEERERQRLLAEEEARLRREEEERRRLARLPKPCLACNGTGACPGCNGSGQLPNLYLAPKIDNKIKHRMDYGRSFHGCGTCGGNPKLIVKTCG